MGSRLVFLVLVCACNPARGERRAVSAPITTTPDTVNGSTTGDASSGTQGTDLVPALDERVALFDRLVAKARSHGAYAPGLAAELGWGWEADLARVRARFVAAGSTRALYEALEMFANSLHNPHAEYEPPERGDTLRLGLSFACEFHEGRPRFYVDAISDATSAPEARAGHLVESYAGIPAADLMRELSLFSSMNNQQALCHDVARLLGRRSTSRSTADIGDPLALELRPRDGGAAYRLTTSWRLREAPGGGIHDQEQVDYHSPECGTLPGRSYPGGYALTDVGYNFCLYTSDKAPYRRYPIVRQFSFQYRRNARSEADIKQLVRVDRALLSHHLDEKRDVSAVILDLRDNGGGNNPNWFLDWWTPGRYMDQFLLLPRRPDLVAAGRLAQVGLSGAQADAYVALGGGQDGGPPIRLPAFTRDGKASWDNIYTPAHRVASAPVVLLTGWQCASTCEAFVNIMDEYDFAPIVGEPSMGGATMLLEGVPVAFPDDPGDYGYLNLPFSQELSGRTGLVQEGRPCTVDLRIDRTFENREHYDQMLVDAAIKISRSFHYQRGLAVPGQK